MDIFQAFFLGIIQGLGEFLPISSSGHLILAPWLFGFPDPGLSFDVALHFGTLLAVLGYFWKDWIDIIRSAFSKNYHFKDTQPTYPKNIFWLIVIATIPGAFFGALLENQAETIFRNPVLIAINLAILGIILFLADKYASGGKTMEKIKIKDALIIGLSQAVAIIPGVSRSGATITAGLAMKLNRTSAARFSFLISAPIILGAVLLKIQYLFGPEFGPEEIAGIISAAVSGFIAIAALLKFLEKSSYKIFFWYRLLVAAAVILVFWSRM